MAMLPRASMPFVLTIIFGIIWSVQGGPPVKRSYTLPSVSDAHYQEILPDGSYKYAYTGEHRYVAERRLADGTVEGESLYIRPDGVPIKVHYFADGKGYRPKTEVLYKERLLTTARRVPVLANRRVVVPVERQVVDVIQPPPAVVIPPPPSSARVNLVDTRSGQAVNLATNGGDVAAAVPSVTAVIGPGAHVVIEPQAEAHSANGGAGFRGVGSGGDLSIANPQVTAIAGVGSSVVIAPKARATSGNVGHQTVREVHHAPHPHVVTPVQRVIPAPPPRVIATHSVPSNGYVYARPTPNVLVPVPPPTVTAVRASGVIVVPPKPSYSYTYSYSAPDGKHPQRDNSAYVNVQVNQ